jgi:hypothetical protein
MIIGVDWIKFNMMKDCLLERRESDVGFDDEVTRQENLKRGLPKRAGYVPPHNPKSILI